MQSFRGLNVNLLASLQLGNTPHAGGVCGWMEIELLQLGFYFMHMVSDIVGKKGKWNYSKLQNIAFKLTKKELLLQQNSTCHFIKLVSS